MSTNQMQLAMDWLHRMRKAHASCPVEVFNGESTITVSMTLERVGYPKFNNDGQVVTRDTRDFVCDRADLVFAGVTRLPAKGWRLTFTLGARTFVYQVEPLGAENCFRYCDAFDNALRIHTVLISSTLAP